MHKTIDRAKICFFMADRFFVCYVAIWIDQNEAKLLIGH